MTKTELSVKIGSTSIYQSLACNENSVSVSTCHSYNSIVLFFELIEVQQGWLSDVVLMT